MLKIDTIFCRLIRELDAHSRASFSTLAQTLKLSEGAIRHRLASLEQAGVELKGYPIIDVGRLGLSVHKVMFKLEKSDEKDINILLKALSSSKCVNWVARFDGQFDIGCTVLVRHVGEVAAFLDSFRAKHHTRIRQLAYAVNLYAEFFPRDYLVSNTRSKPLAASYHSFPSAKDSVVLSERDWKLLAALAADVRISLTDASKATGMSVDTVRRRIDFFESSRLIAGYRLALDHRVLKRMSIYLLIHINPVSESRLSEFVHHLRRTPTVVYLIRMLGGWDFDVSLEVADAAEYRDFSIGLMKRFSDVIRDITSLTTWSVNKFSILPMEYGGDRNTEAK